MSLEECRRTANKSGTRSGFTHSIQWGEDLGTDKEAAMLAGAAHPPGAKEGPQIHIWHPDSPDRVLCGHDAPQFTVSPAASRKFDGSLLCLGCSRAMAESVRKSGYADAAFADNREYRDQVGNAENLADAAADVE
jgi:hypothetical protein